MTTSIIREEGDLIVSENTNYQGYTFNKSTKVCTPTNHRTIPKWEALKGIWPDIIPNNSFMDLGSSMGFFCFKAVEFGATRSIGVESHSSYFNAVSKVCGDFVEYVNARFPTINGLQSDVVMALSLIHHLSRGYSLEQIAEDLSNATEKFLIIEWIGKDDRTNAKYHYEESHSWENMEFFLLERFKTVEFINHGHHKARLIFLCSK